MTNREWSLVAAAKDFFGMLPGQKASDFLKEFKELTEADKVEFKTALTGIGYNIK